MFLARHHMLARTYVTQDGVCQFDMDESACKVELRHRATKQVVLRHRQHDDAEGIQCSKGKE